MHPRFSARLRLVTALAILAWLTAPAVVRAASKVKIASIGDQAPGGGQFLGPSLTGSPSAAGNGWVAFRTLVTEGSTNEQIVVTKLAGQEQRHVVAAIGQSAGKRGDKDLGTFRMFLGRPTVNGNGDVAFVAALTNSDAIPGGEDALGLALPAGVFLWRRSVPANQPRLRVVALSRDVIPGMGALDLTTTLDVLQESSSIDLLERTPGLNDAGEVAFIGLTIDDTGFPVKESGAVFVGTVGSTPIPRIRIDDPFNGGRFVYLGSPAINTSGVLAFRATVDGEIVSGEPLSLDGVFTLAGSTLTRLAADGDLLIPPDDPENSQQLFGYGDLVSINDSGDVAFTAGGMLDLVSFSSSEFQFGVLVARQGAVHLVTYPGQAVEGFGRIRGGTLGPDGGNEVATPAIMPDGSVHVFAELTGGNGQAFFHPEPPDYDLGTPLLILGGPDPDPSPLGGVYFAAVSGPAADAGGNVTFFARLAGAPVREALIFRPASGTANSIVIGEATPTKGRFGGPPFSAPVVNDSDTVVFKGAVATGPSSLGIFRWRRNDPPESRLAVLVRTGDAAPLPGAPLILDLPGEASLNASGDVAFAAIVAGIGRVVFAIGPGGVRTIALPDQPIPFVAPDAQIDTVATNPLMMADGTVTFRASFAYEDPFLFTLEREEGLFRVDPAGNMVLFARTAQASPSGPPFFRFRDLSTNGSSIVVRAPIGDPDSLEPDFLPVGFFLIDPSSAIRTVVLDDQMVGGSVKLDALTGRATVDAAGNVAFLGRFGVDERTVLVRAATDGTSTVLAQIGNPGPAGGSYRSIGRPTMSTAGHVAYRGGFERFGGGTGGFFLATDANASPSPFIQIGEPDEDGAGGRLTSLNPTATLNALDHLAFVGSVSAGNSRNGIFLAAPTKTRVLSLAVRWREKDVEGVPFPFGSARGRVDLEFGDLGKGLQLDTQGAAVVVTDANGVLFSGTVSKGNLVARGKGFGLKRRTAGLKKLQVKRLGKRARGVRVTFKTGQWNFPIRTGDELQNPLSVRIDVGAHSGTAILTCTTGREQGATCDGS
jgi:hypothetical protein